jgi:hypothetical protein
MIAVFMIKGSGWIRLSVEPIFSKQRTGRIPPNTLFVFERLSNTSRKINPLMDLTEEWNPSRRLTIFDNSDIIPHETILTFVVPHSEVHKRIDFVW